MTALLFDWCMSKMRLVGSTHRQTLTQLVLFSEISRISTLQINNEKKGLA